jgi:hypothetical protein
MLNFSGEPVGWSTALHAEPRGIVTRLLHHVTRWNRPIAKTLSRYDRNQSAILCSSSARPYSEIGNHGGLRNRKFRFES